MDRHLEYLKYKDTNKRLRQLPWYKAYYRIINRTVSRPRGKYLTIKNYLTIADLKYLWFRDKGDLLKSPSIDRIDAKGNYTLENCRFIERSENVRRGALERWYPSEGQRQIKKRPNKNNRSGYKGVAHISPNRWVARMSVNGKRISLGLYKSAQEAGEAWEKGMRESNAVELV